MEAQKAPVCLPQGQREVGQEPVPSEDVTNVTGVVSELLIAVIAASLLQLERVTWSEHQSGEDLAGGLELEFGS